MQPPDLHHLELVARLALATGLGALVGVEREWRDRAAGLRTHMLVCVGAAVFTIVSAYGFRDWYEMLPSNQRANVVSDPTRIAAQIVTGIGFLGAGAIFRSDDGVRGLTTAASLWVMAAIGLAAGAGYYELAVASTLLILIVLGAMRGFSRRVNRMHRAGHFDVNIVVSDTAALRHIFDCVAASGATIAEFHSASMQGGVASQRLSFNLVLPADDDASALIGKLATLEFVESVAAPDLHE